MTVQELYSSLNADLADALSRLMREDLVARFVVSLIEDPEYDKLKAAVKEENWGDAFRAAHTLKGTSANLGLSVLSQKAGTVTEALRNGAPDIDISNIVTELDEEYIKTIKLLKEFKGI